MTTQLAEVNNDSPVVDSMHECGHLTLLEHIADVPASQPRFINPCMPTAVKAPPRGDHWLHEAKLDGWRIQIVKAGREARLTKRLGGLLPFQQGAISLGPRADGGLDPAIGWRAASP